MAKDDLTAQRLRELVDYDPDTGLFTWRVSLRGGAAIAGKLATGTLNDHGYQILGIDGYRHRGHRLAWLHVHGRFPRNFIDHINGVRTDNRIVNLRDVTNAENLQNLQKARADNAAQILGICAHGTRWKAEICHDGKKFHLGVYATRDEAAAAYEGAKRVLHKNARPE